jgi:hypothetical protein
VPTKISLIDGKWYAVISSLTNSTYTVIWHPLEFTDATDHWANDPVNDMGARMGRIRRGRILYEPDRNVTGRSLRRSSSGRWALCRKRGEHCFSDVCEGGLVLCLRRNGGILR